MSLGAARAKILEHNFQPPKVDDYENIDAQFGSGTGCGAGQRSLRRRPGRAPGGVTGKIVELMPMRATLETGKRGGLFYINTAFDTREKHLKVGQYVTFHYYLTGRTLIADSVEQAGETGKGSKKHEKAAANASASAER